MNNYSTTLSEAINDLKKRGFTIDFNLGFNGIKSNNPMPSTSLAPDKFEITEVYRFEGETDPDDEAVVYAIESKEGYKGILVNGYGISADTFPGQLIKELTIRK